MGAHSQNQRQKIILKEIKLALLSKATLAQDLSLLMSLVLKRVRPAPPPYPLSPEQSVPISFQMTASLLSLGLSPSMCPCTVGPEETHRQKETALRSYQNNTQLCLYCKLESSTFSPLNFDGKV